MALPAPVVARGRDHAARTQRAGGNARADDRGRAQGAGESRLHHAQEDGGGSPQDLHPSDAARQGTRTDPRRSEEHTSELQSLMRISYAVFCLKKKPKTITNTTPTQ